MKAKGREEKMVGRCVDPNSIIVEFLEDAVFVIRVRIAISADVHLAGGGGGGCKT